MKRKEQTKTFMMILNWKNPTLFSMVYTKVFQRCKGWRWPSINTSLCEHLVFFNGNPSRTDFLYIKASRNSPVYDSVRRSVYPPPVRGILVAPKFCSASGVWRPASRFLVGAKTQKLLVKFFWNFNMTFLGTWGCASDFLVMLPKFKMAARGKF